MMRRRPLLAYRFNGFSNTCTLRRMETGGHPWPAYFSRGGMVQPRAKDLNMHNAGSLLDHDSWAQRIPTATGTCLSTNSDANTLTCLQRSADCAAIGKMC